MTLNTQPRRTVAALLAWIAVSFVPASLGAAFRPGAWYAAIAKPSWTPPGWIFGPVWTALYLSMGIAAWMVWARGSGPRGAALGVFVVQLALNAAWSPVFFGLRNPGAAVGIIIAMWLAIAATIALFWRVRPIASAMLIPYLLWVSFATALNIAIWRLNAG